MTGALVAVRKPTIAALPGAAAGAGMALALACDIRIAAESAIMSTGYARIGLTGDYGIAWMLTRLAPSVSAASFIGATASPPRSYSMRIGRNCEVLAPKQQSTLSAAPPNGGELGSDPEHAFNASLLSKVWSISSPEHHADWNTVKKGLTSRDTE